MNNILFSGIILVFGTLNLQAHPVSISQVDIYIFPAEVRMSLYILAEDFFFYQNLCSDENEEISVKKLKESATLHQDFLQKFLYLSEEDGSQLLGNVQFMGGLEQFENDSTLLKRWRNIPIQYEISFPVSNEQELFINQDFGGTQHPIYSIMIATIYLNNVLQEKMVEITKGQPYLLHLKSKNANTAFVDGSFEAFKIQKLGKKKTDLIQSKLLVKENYIVHELQFPLAWLSQWAGVSQNVNTEDFTKNRPLLVSFFKEQFSIFVNDEPVLPKITFRNNSTKQAEIIQKEDILNIELKYPFEEYKMKNIRIPWNCFDHILKRVQTQVELPDSSVEFTFTRYRPEFIWEVSQN